MTGNDVRGENVSATVFACNVSCGSCHFRLAFLLLDLNLEGNRLGILDPEAPGDEVREAGDVPAREDLLVAVVNATDRADEGQLGRIPVLHDDLKFVIPSLFTCSHEVNPNDPELQLEVLDDDSVELSFFKDASLRSPVQILRLGEVFLFKEELNPEREIV